MILLRVISLVGVAMLVMIANVAASVLYMVVYGHAINRGHPESFYKEHIKVAAPYCSIVAGIPLMFLAGWWVGGWWNGEGGVTAALTVGIAYAIIDVAVLLAAGMNRKLAILAAISFLTKLAAVYAGGAVAVHRAAASTPLVPG